MSLAEALLSPRSLSREIDALGAGQFLADPIELVREALGLLQPPERISTVECAERNRLLPGSEDGAVVRYDRWRTPYNVGPMNSLDDPKCKLLVMVKPSRSGGTTVAENYLFKMMMLGPMGHVSWVLNSDEAVTDYCRTVVKPMFELNGALGEVTGKSTDTYREIRGYPVEWLSAKDSTFRNRQPIFMVSDETDAWSKRFAATPKVQIDARQKMLGHRRKGAIMSHPDLGWNSGVAACFEDSSRGIYIMRCAECLGYASAYATRFWDNVPEFKLHWTRSDSAGTDARLDLAERSAAMLCPHCGALLTDEQRRQMVDDALSENQNGLAGWMHRGQNLDALQGIIGEMEDRETHAFWVHGLMLKTVTLASLAREYEAALIRYERTRDPSQLKEFMAKALGEVFEGAASTGGVSARALKARVEDAGYDRGVVPDDVRFITAAVDTGGRKFDVAWIGWDLEARSWLLDRITIRQRLHDDGEWRDIHTGGNLDDWLLLLTKVADRRFPLARDPDLLMPTAVTVVDSGDGNVTEKARAFARMADRRGYKWANWSKVKLIKGVAGKRPILPDAPRKIDKDELGKPVEPVITEYSLGVDQLKSLVLERLAIDDGSPGQCAFPRELEGRYIDEFFGESLIDGKWRRSGPNEMLDLYGYAEAGRLMLKPDRPDLDWTGRKKALPIWAKPVRLEPRGGDQLPPGASAPEPEKPKPSILNRFEGLHRG